VAEGLPSRFSRNHPCRAILHSKCKIAEPVSTPVQKCIRNAKLQAPFLPPCKNAFGMQNCKTGGLEALEATLGATEMSTCHGKTGHTDVQLRPRKCPLLVQNPAKTHALTRAKWTVSGQKSIKLDILRGKQKFLFERTQNGHHHILGVAAVLRVGFF
jgi:hypothetical protein